MRSLSSAELLSIWERGTGRVPVERAVALAAAASPELTADDVAALPIGARDARLLALRERTFGTAIEAVAACPACGEQLELDFDATAIGGTPDPDAAPRIVVNGQEIALRCPTSADVVETLSTTDAADRRLELIARCACVVREGGTEPLDARTLAPDVADAIVARLAALDPRADVLLGLDCPACRHRWDASFDVAAYLWSEIEVWAHRLLGDVHALASAYGWTEDAILALSPLRRQLYLEAVLR